MRHWPWTIFSWWRLGRRQAAGMAIGWSSIQAGLVLSIWHLLCRRTSVFPQLTELVFRLTTVFTLEDKPLSRFSSSQTSLRGIRASSGIMGWMSSRRSSSFFLMCSSPLCSSTRGTFSVRCFRRSEHSFLTNVFLDQMSSPLTECPVWALGDGVLIM